MGVNSSGQGLSRQSKGSKPGQGAVVFYVLQCKDVGHTDDAGTRTSRGVTKRGLKLVGY